MKRWREIERRASIAAKRLRTLVSPQPSRSSSFVALRAEPLDVEGVARDEMLQPLDGLRRADEAARAAAHRVLLAGAGVDLAHRMAAAGGADGREHVGLRV